MIVFDHVSLKYRYDEFALLKDVSFSLNSGVNTVLCDIQSGKSSVCKLLTKQVYPSDGKIIYFGDEISCITNERLGILYLSNTSALFERRSVLYNIEYPLAVRKMPRNERRAIALEAARLVGIADVEVNASKLNSAQRKLVALARGLTVSRKAVLFDDFFEEGDDVNAIVELFDAEIKVVLTSDVSKAQGNVIVLDGGYTVYQGDNVKAEQIVQELNWLYDELRRENGK